MVQADKTVKASKDTQPEDRYLTRGPGSHRVVQSSKLRTRREKAIAEVTVINSSFTSKIDMVGGIGMVVLGFMLNFAVFLCVVNCLGSKYALMRNGTFVNTTAVNKTEITANETDGFEDLDANCPNAYPRLNLFKVVTMIVGSYFIILYGLALFWTNYRLQRGLPMKKYLSFFIRWFAVRFLLLAGVLMVMLTFAEEVKIPVEWLYFFAIFYGVNSLILETCHQREMTVMKTGDNQPTIPKTKPINYFTHRLPSPPNHTFVSLANLHNPVASHGKMHTMNPIIFGNHEFTTQCMREFIPTSDTESLDYQTEASPYYYCEDYTEEATCNPKPNFSTPQDEGLQMNKKEGKKETKVNIN